ncbi:MAG: hypothetical protein ACR2RV_10830, partial [Verrucomicrobiales bacterium]
MNPPKTILSQTSQWLRGIFACTLSLAICAPVCADEKPEFTDYCERLEQEIEGRKHGFLAGNVTYYVGGYHASWKPT